MSEAESQSKLLVMTLQCAVPLRIINIRRRGGPTDEDFKRASEFSTKLGERGDVLLFGGGKEGEVADLFNQLAEAIALLAFAPGGVHLFGQHWCAGPTPRKRARVL